MKSLTLVALALFSVTHAQASSNLANCEAQVEPFVPPRAEIGWAVGAQVRHESVLTDFRKLTGLEDITPGTRIPDRYTDENKRIAAQYFADRFSEIGYEPTFEDFIKNEKLPPRKEGQPPRYRLRPGRNIVAEIRGTRFPDQIIEVNAHYDTTAPNKPGADDNASGIVSVLELARLMKENPPEKTVRFIIADWEEKGHDGAIYHALEVAGRGELVEAALVIDMIGYFPENYPGGERFVVEMGSEKHVEAGKATATGIALSRAFGESLIAQHKSRGDREIQARRALNSALPNTADHGPYWTLGIPAVLVAAPYENGTINPHYHRTTDTVHTMNLGYLFKILRFMAEGLAVTAGAK